MNDGHHCAADPVAALPVVLKRKHGTCRFGTIAARKRSDAGSADLCGHKSRCCQRLRFLPGIAYGGVLWQERRSVAGEGGGSVNGS